MEKLKMVVDIIVENVETYSDLEGLVCSGDCFVKEFIPHMAFQGATNMPVLILGRKKEKTNAKEKE